MVLFSSFFERRGGGQWGHRVVRGGEGGRKERREMGCGKSGEGVGFRGFVRRESRLTVGAEVSRAEESPMRSRRR